ncbi:2Fe-2S iron-sulfur cluster-binding protein [Streptomyces sp. NPDC048219]|uniref:2Fe-2S iron-sulfur cluster-binding protein n=1 Tax=Streptomyces sp. NPDC048219 TaxID=3365517 RepID=UPI003716F982
MTDDQHGEDAPRSGGRWDPLPQGDYDDGATAFVKLPEGGIDALLASADSPLAAPGHGYVPPQITVAPATTAGTDPAATGSWALPSAPVDGAQWHVPDAGQQYPGHQEFTGYAQQDPYGQAAGYDPHAGHGDRFTYHPGATGQWDFSDAAADNAASDAEAGHEAPGQDVTGQWSIPVAGGDLPDESGEFTASSLAEQWGGTAPATLPGGAPAPWATQPWAQEPAGPDRAGDDLAAGTAQDSAPSAGPGPFPVRTAGAYPHAPAEPGAGTVPPAPSADGTTTGEAPADEVPADGTGPDGTGLNATSPDGTAPDGMASDGMPSDGTASDEPAPDDTAPGQGAVDEAVTGEAATDEAATGEAPAAEEASEAEEAPEAPEGSAEPPVAPTGDEETAPDPESPEAAPTDPAPSAEPVAAQETEDEPRPEPPGSAAPAEPAPAAPVGPQDEHPLASYVLRVNGADRPVTDAWIGESLLYVLRERLGLAGAKDGCSQGECGACNVQVDGRLVASCLVPAVTAAGSEVRTVEGLAADGQPSDVQRALARCGAVQCGFCVPGMAMTLHNLLEGNPAPTDLEARQALCGNLCRCSGYRGVLDAVREVVAERAAHSAAGAAEADTDEPRIPHQAGPGAGGVNASAFESPGPPGTPDAPAPHDQPHGDEPYPEQPYGDEPYGEQSYGDHPYGDRPYADQPYDDRSHGQDGGHA